MVPTFVPVGFVATGPAGSAALDPAALGAAGNPAEGKFAELYLDDQDRVQMVIALNPGDDQFETLEKLARQRPSVRGREGEISRPGFSLDALVS